MHVKTSLFTGAAIGALFVLAGATTAEAKAHHRHAAAPATSAEALEIEQLRQSVAELTARLNASDAARAQAQATATAAQEQATAAKDAAQVAQARTEDEIKTIPTQVSTAVAAIPKPKVGWWGDTSVSGRAYMDLSYINQKVDGVKVPGSPNGVSVDIKRFYVSIDHKFNDVFSADLTTDFTYDGAASASVIAPPVGPTPTQVNPLASTNTTQVYIKKAYLQAKLNDAFIVRLGAADLPWVPFVEDTYGYRYIENVMVDRDKFGTSADWGAHVLGSVPLGMVKVSYDFAAINGAGYKKPGFIAGVNRSKDMDFEGRVSANMGHFVAAVGGYDGKLGNAVQGVVTFHTAQRFDALLAYVDDRIRLGGEYFYASDWSDVKQADPTKTNSSEGLSAFGSFKFTPQFSVFGRYDWVKPKRDTAPTLKDNYFNFGLQYEPVKIVDLSLVYKRDKIDNGTFSTQNGTIGGVGSGTYDEIGLFTQFRW